MEKHMIRIHGRRAEFYCENCKKEFGRSHVLKEHKIVTNVRTYLPEGVEWRNI